METQEGLASVEETSKRLSVSTFTTRRLIKAGHLRGVYIGKRLLVPHSEIARAVAHGCGKHAGKGNGHDIPAQQERQ